MSVPYWLEASLEVSRYPLPPSPGGRTGRAGTVTAAAVRPFSAEELESAWGEWSGYSPVLADVLLVLARTGLRWSEARALAVGDANPERITVARSAREGGPVRCYPARRVRGVPVEARVRPIVQRLLAGRDADEPLFATSLGEPLRRAPVLRRLNWPETGRGRRLQDLRHTAASLWLADGAAPAEVRAWLG